MPGISIHAFRLILYENPILRSGSSPKEHLPRSCSHRPGLSSLCSCGDERIAEGFRLRAKSRLCPCAETALILTEDGLVVGVPRAEHVKHNARQFVRSRRNRRWGSQLCSHASEKVTKRGLAPEQRVRSHAECQCRAIVHTPRFYAQDLASTDVVVRTQPQPRGEC